MKAKDKWDNFFPNTLYQRIPLDWKFPLLNSGFEWHLEKSLEKVKDISLNTNDFYYLSNSKSVALYFKTQFALAPKVVIKKEFSDIPEDSYILAVIENKSKSKKLISKKIIKIKDTIINIIDNNNYQIMLLKK